MRASAGFTLIELLIVMVVIAILASIALPSYTRYVQRGDLVEATNALAQYRVQLEQWYQDNNTYADSTATTCGVAPPAGLTNFTVTCALAGGGGQGYTATATANLGSPVNGFVYTIDQANNQQTTGLPSGWSSASLPATGWIVR